MVHGDEGIWCEMGKSGDVDLVCQLLNYINPESRELDHVLGSGLLNYINPENREIDNVQSIQFESQLHCMQVGGWLLHIVEQCAMHNALCIVCIHVASE